MASKRKAPQFKSASVITIHNADLMNCRGRHDIARWMRRQAEWLVKHGDNYAGRFTARYLYQARKASPRKAAKKTTTKKPSKRRAA